MPRLKRMLMLRKYVFIFFGVLLVFIWLNYRNKSNEQNIVFEQFPAVAKDILPDTSPPNLIAREQQIREMIRANRMRKVQQTDEPKVSKIRFADEFGISFDDDDDSLEMVAKPTRYLVNSMKCKMPFADPFSRAVMEVLKPSKLKSCSNATDAFRVQYDDQAKHYNLIVDRDILLKLNPLVSSVDCSYRKIDTLDTERPEHNSNINAPVYFRGQCALPQDVESIMVECHDSFNRSRILQRDAIIVIQVNDTSKNTENRPVERQPSVIVLGLGSMSRMNFQRTMPKTARFVNQMGWFELEGYNKMADTTIPNLLTMLSGHTMGQLENRCTPESDGCSWIWSDYKRAGYVTALAEDNVGEAAFLKNMPGFEDVAVDYDLRPLLLGIGSALSMYEKSGYSYCVGRRLSISYVYEFCAQFAASFARKGDRPVFGFFWSNTITQSSNFAASGLDGIFANYLNRLEQAKLFDNSIVVLVSDHGARDGVLMDLSDSFLEERLPLLHIYLPPWFRSTYPQYAHALAMNHNRLCSNFDLYNTLRHLIQLNATTPAMLPVLASCPSSQSLLHLLPTERSCQDACVKEHWCTCNGFERQSLDGEMYLLGKRVVYHINRWMLMQRYNEFCQRLGLQDMDMAEQKMSYEQNGRVGMYGSIVVYRLRFRTYPYVGKFQATVRYNRELESIEDLHVPDISRLNSYKNSSECIKDDVAKKFCFCYPKSKLSGAMKEWQAQKISTVPAF
ncbi:uncharacterized protein LOC6576579 [Drosophila mojavensis]|uniref:Uncharacterized protein n=1 Tax=Drosophila mojavensis TaxID=7230 RepID=B4KFB0_DROMO|nr:uncharacterized protein LOC6576579 [Drosophila mojavensis]EDW12010.2 uncharacterized protein Dmoj_GI17451 [Drosophila mojavensis]